MNNILTIAARALVICGAATLACNATAVSAGSLDESDAPVKYTVPFKDLDLSRIEGATALYGRLRHAARAACEPLLSVQHEKYRACVGRAIADAVARVNRPLLSQYHQLHLNRDRAGLAQLAKGH